MRIINIIQYRKSHFIVYIYVYAPKFKVMIKVTLQ